MDLIKGYKLRRNQSVVVKEYYSWLNAAVKSEVDRTLPKTL